MHIAHCTVADIEAAPNIGKLLAEYTAEAGIPELGAPAAQFDTYRLLESTGALRVIGAFRDEQLAGFVTVLLSTLPHFGKRAAVVESLFVSPAARDLGYGVGGALMREAESYAREQGAEAILYSTPAGGSLEKALMRREPYRATNTIFFRSLV